MPFRIDRVPIKKYEEMPNGSLRLLGTIARVGELKYLNHDGTVRVEHLDADELFNEKWLDSLANSWVTLGHPPTKVSPDNFKDYVVGAVGGIPIPRREDGELDFVHIIGDRTAIDAIKSRKATQLSPGYDVNLHMDGGQLYQRDRVANHSAIVSLARGGARCNLRLDGVDDFAVQLLGNEPIDLDMQGFGSREHNNRADDKSNGGTPAMPTAIPIGNRTYSVDGDDGPALADAIAAVLDKGSELEKTVSTVTDQATEHKDRADAAETKLTTVQGELKGAQTKLDEANTKLSEAEKTRMDDDAIATAVSTRMDAWGLVLPAIRQDQPDFEPNWKLDEMDVKRLWLLRKDESLKDDPAFKTDGFVNGLWRSLKPEPVEHADNVDGLAALVTLARGDRNDAGGGYMSDRRAKQTKEDRRKARSERIAANGRSLMGGNN